MQRINPEYYISYYTIDHQVDTDQLNLSCGTEPLEHSNDHGMDEFNPKDEEINWKGVETGDSIKMQIYRLALSCTGEWGSRQGTTVEEVLADMNTSVNRLNLIFENELAIRVLLINRNDELIFMDPDTDPL